MLDIRYIRENTELVKEGARKKRIPVDIDRLLAVDDERRSLLQESENLKAEKNKANLEIASLKGPEKADAIARMKGVAEKVKELETRLEAVQEEFNTLMLRVPNPPDDEVPEGKDDTEDRKSVV